MIAVERATGSRVLVGAFSAQSVSVERATGDNALAKSFSAQSVSVEHATGDSKLVKSLSTSKAGYDINGTEIVVPEIVTHIARVK